MKTLPTLVLSLLLGAAGIAAAQTVPIAEGMPNPTGTDLMLPPTADLMTTSADSARYWQPRAADPSKYQDLAALLPKAQSGDEAAQLHLASSFLRARFGLANNVQAATWYKQVLDAGQQDRGYYIAAGEYGLMVLLGRGVTQDQVRGEQLISLAADHGFRQAYASMALMYMTGWGLPVDYTAAKSWLDKAITRPGDQHIPFAQTLMGDLYLEGWGVEQDSQLAFHHFDLGAGVGDSDGEVKLAEMYMYGIGTDTDFGRAQELFHEAAIQGNPLAFFGTAQLYSRGRLDPNGKRNFRLAYLNYVQAGREGFPRALGELAYYTFKGMGCPKDVRLAFRMANRAAAHGSAVGQRFLPEITAAYQALPPLPKATPSGPPK